MFATYFKHAYHQGCGQIFESSADKMLLTTQYVLPLSCWQTAAWAVLHNVHKTQKQSWCFEISCYRIASLASL